MTPILWFCSQTPLRPFISYYILLHCTWPYIDLCGPVVNWSSPVFPFTLANAFIPNLFVKVILCMCSMTFGFQYTRAPSLLESRKTRLCCSTSCPRTRWTWWDSPRGCNLTFKHLGSPASHLEVLANIVAAVSMGGGSRLLNAFTRTNYFSQGDVILQSRPSG